MSSHDQPAWALSQQITLVSVTSGGVLGNGYSSYSVISVDGCYVAFYSSANNLVVNDTNENGDIFFMIV